MKFRPWYGQDKWSIELLGNMVWVQNVLLKCYPIKLYFIALWHFISINTNILFDKKTSISFFVK